MATSGSDGRQLFGLFRWQADGSWEALPEQKQIGSRVVLYVHGWQSGHYESVCDRESPLALPFESFWTPDYYEGYCEERMDLAAAWREQDYDVLGFCWAPFADEPNVKDAQLKIWEDAGPHRWRSGSKSFETEGAPPGSFGRALFEAYCSAFTTCDYIHVVGHSLGSQMVSSLVQQCLEARDVLVPQRITLLDPYFTNFTQLSESTCSLHYLQGDWPGERVRATMARAAASGAAVEQYRSSKVLDNPLSDANEKLKEITAYFVMQPEFIQVKYGIGDIEVLANRHSYAKYCYFSSKAHPPPKEIASRGQTPSGEAKGVAYANASDEDIRHMMGAENHWIQVEGMYTPDVTKHVYQRKAGSSDSSCGGLKEFIMGG